MKKRLLSALLAMVMVLAMLPMSAFAVVDSSTASAPGDGESVSITVQADGTQKGSYSYKTTEDGKSVTKKVTDWTPSGGFLVGTRSNATSNFSGTWYTNFRDAYAKGASIILFTDVNSALDWADIGGTSGMKNLTIDVNGHDFTLGDVTTVLNSTNKNLSQLTFKDFPYNSNSDVGSVTGSITTTGKGFTLNVTNVDASGLDLTVNGTDKTGQTLIATVDGKKAQMGDMIAVNGKVNINVKNGASAGGVYASSDASNPKASARSNGSTITVDGQSSLGTGSGKGVALAGTATLNVKGMSQVGAVTLYGGGAGDNTSDAAKAPTWKGATINIDGTSSVTSIEQQDGDWVGHTVNLTNNSSVGAVTLDQGGTSTVSVTNSTTDDITMVRGTLNIKNSGVASVSSAEMIDEPLKSGTLTVNVGTKGQEDTSKVGDLTKDQNATITPALYLYGGEVGTFEDWAHEVWGGKTGKSVAKVNLKGGLADGFEYAVGSAGDEVFGYTTDFQDLVDEYKLCGDTNWTAKRVGEDITSAAELTFQWDDATTSPQVLTKLKIAQKGFIKLPTMVNKTTVNYWHDIDAKGDQQGIAAGTNYQIEKNAMTLIVHLDPNTSSSVTKITAVDTGNSNTPVACNVNGTTINLSGAVKENGGTAHLTLYFAVDGETGTPGRHVDVGWSTDGTIVLSNPSTDNAVVIPVRQSNQVTVFNTTYTVTGTGLKAMPSGVEVNDGDSTGFTGVQGGVTVPNASAGMTGSYVELGKNLKAALESADSKVIFAGSNGIKAALNALVNSQSESSLTSMCNSARSAMASYRNKAEKVTTYKAADFNEYNQVELRPYLEISSSNPTVFGDGSSPGLTLTINLKYRYMVTDGTNYAIKDMVDSNPVYWEQTGALNVTGDYGEVEITLAVPTALGFTGTTASSHAHHYGFVTEVTRAAGGNGKNDTLAFSSFNGFSPFTLNNEPGKVSLDGVTDYTFDNIQTAVDEVANNGKVVVDDNYSGPINVSGSSKKFEITATQGHTVTITAVNGATNTYDYNQNTGTYTIQQTSNAPVTGNVSISLGSYSNGTASLSTSKAAPGSTVTVNLTPAAGYIVSGVTAKTNTGANVALTATGTANQYTFTVPSGATSVTVTPTFAASGVASVIVNSTAYGTATTSAAGGTVQTGSTVTVYLTPNAGCRTIGLTVRTNSGSSVYVNQVNTNQYTFTVPGGATSVTVTPSFDRDTGMPFLDVLSTDSYLSYVQYVYGHGMVNGSTPTTFSGNDVITRAQIVTILYRLSNSPAVTGSSSFVDVPAGVYAAPVAWAQANGVVTGTSPTTFEPDRAITRQELAAILYRYHVNVRKMPATNLANLGAYTDRGQVAADWAMTPVQWCVGNGIINGTTPTTLEPNGTAIRYHAAAMLTRYCQNILGIQ